MRKMINIFAAALVMLAAISCEKNEVLPDNSAKGKITLSATINNGATKTALGEKDGDTYPVFWSENDAIAVIQNNKLYKFVLSEGKGTTSGKFVLAEGQPEGFTTDGEIKAFYPYEGVKFENSTISYTVPAAQIYQPASFGQGAMPMAAYRVAGSAAALSFDNLFGVLKLQFKGAAGEIITSISVTSDQALVGTAAASIGASGNSIALTADENNKTVTLNCGNGTVMSTENIIEFLISLPANAESAMHQLQIAVSTTINGASKSYTFTTKQTIIAGQIKKLPLRSLTSIAYIENGVYLGDGVELPAGNNTTVIWAPVNCGYDEDHKYGLLYQWGRKYGQDYGELPSDNLIKSVLTSAGEGSLPANKDNFYYGSYCWLSSDIVDNLWYNNAQGVTTNKTEYDPCPEGWRVPTNEELISLGKGLTEGGYVNGLQWETIKDQNDKHVGMKGSWFYGNTSEKSGPRIFLPAAGYRDYTDGEAERKDEYGYYWSSTQKVPGSSAFFLYFYKYGGLNSSFWGCAMGMSVRCVKE